MKKFFKEFKQFISRGNVMDMAIGVIIGGAFSAIVTALTNKIIMPVINWILSLGGQNGLESARTILGEAVYNTPGEVESGINWASTIYIDWGAFITAIIDFLLIALVLFTILKAVMNAQGFIAKSQSAKPTKEEKKALKEKGVDMKDRTAVLVATNELREQKRLEAEAEAKVKEEATVTTEKLLVEIRDLLKEDSSKSETKKKTAKSK